MIEKSKQPGMLTKVRALKTDTGIKDKFLDHFLESMAKSYRGIRGRLPQANALNEFCATLPDNITSPVWRINGEAAFICNIILMNLKWHTGLDPPTLQSKFSIQSSSVSSSTFGEMLYRTNPRKLAQRDICLKRDCLPSIHLDLVAPSSRVQRLSTTPVH